MYNLLIVNRGGDDLNRIDAIRKKKHLSYGKISEKSGLSSVYIYLLAKEKRMNPSLEAMKKIAEALGEKVEKVFLINMNSGVH